MRDYIEPATGPTALLTYENSGDPEGSAIVFEDAKECAGRYFFGRHLPSGAIVRTGIKAGEELALAFAYGDEVRPRCEIYISFTPSPRSAYRARLFDLDERHCGFTLDEQMPDGSFARVKVNRRTSVRPAWNENSAFCAPPRL